MLLQSTAYTASLMDYTSQVARCSVKQLVERIGSKGLTRLVHNAPMHQHLPYHRIANEVIHDYGIVYRYPAGIAVWNDDYGKKIMTFVESRTTNKQEYGPVLYEILTADCTGAQG